jgi:hypothetical protein
MRPLDLLYQLPLWVIALSLTSVPLFLAPWVTRELDARGLPGFAIAMVLILLGPVLAGLFYIREIPSARRARELKRDADQLGLHFARRFALPGSMYALPSLAGLEVVTSMGLGAAVGAANLVSGRLGDDEVVAFDFWVKDDSPYTPAEWRSLVAVSTTIEAEPVIIEPKHGVTWGKAPGIDEIRTESGAFDRRYRVWCSDRRFTSAFLDQRMMAWLLELEGDRRLQAGGRWVAVVGPPFHGTELEEAIELVRAFRTHIPRVVSSTYPLPDPGFA